MHFSTTTLTSTLLLSLPLLTSALFPVSDATLPSCAQACSINLPTDCLGDPLCICKDTTWISQAYCCSEAKCNPVELALTKNFAAMICSAVGQKIVKPASCPAGAGPPAATLGAPTTMILSTATAAADVTAMNKGGASVKMSATPAPPASGSTLGDRIKAVEGGLFGKGFKA